MLAEKLCAAFGASCGSSEAAPDEKAPPARACERASTTVEGGLNASVLFVNGEQNRSVTTRELSDGTFVVEVVDRKSTRLNSSHVAISYAVFCLKKNIQSLQPNAADDL